MYASSDIKILKILSRGEIVDIVLEKGDMTRLVSLYKLTDEEIDYILDKYNGNINLLSRYIDYYQKGDKDAFVKSRY